MLLSRTITVTTRPSPTNLPNSGTGTELSKYFFMHNKVFSPSLSQCSGELIRSSRRKTKQFSSYFRFPTSHTTTHAVPHVAVLYLGYHLRYSS